MFRGIKRFFRRVVDDPRRTRRYCLLMMLLIVVFGVVVLVPVATRGEAPSSAPTEDERIVLYTDLKLGEMYREKFEGVAENPYDAQAFAIQEDGSIRYETPELTASRGIDVSSHQQEIDWQKVKANGVDFAMIRAGYRGYSEGTIKMDAFFEQNIQGALENGIQVGVYFFSQALNEQEAREEAKTLLGWIKEYDVTFPVVYDWETVEAESPRTAEMEGEAVSRCALAFCKEVEDAGYTPAVYFSARMALLYYDLSLIRDYDFWLAEYHDAPNFYYNFQIWQYTASGKVDGINGNVDMNLCFKKYGE